MHMCTKARACTLLVERSFTCTLCVTTRELVLVHVQSKEMKRPTKRGRQRPTAMAVVQRPPLPWTTHLSPTLHRQASWHQRPTWCALSHVLVCACASSHLMSVAGSNMPLSGCRSSVLA